jgi:DNA-binding transcriptional ArsR family regulator
MSKKLIRRTSDTRKPSGSGSSGRIRRRQIELLWVAEFMRRGYSNATASFFVQVYEALAEGDVVSAKDLADATDVLPPTALHHVRRLEDWGVLERVHYRGWRLNADFIHSLNETEIR